MKITNTTRWLTTDLRALIAAALDADGIGPQGMTVVVKPARNPNWCSGYAWLHGRTIIVRVPQPKAEESALSDHLRDDLARIIIHEAAHCRGVDHADMHGNLRRAHDRCGHTDDRDVSFAAAMRVRAKPVKVKAPVDHVARRAAHAAAKLSEAERRLKLARTIAAKWRAKVRYYERRAAAQGTVQP